MTSKGKTLLFLLISLCIIIFTPYSGELYEKIIGRKISTGFWGPSHPEYIEGFFLSYTFFVSLFVTIFVEAKKYIIWGILIGIALLFDLMLGAWESFIIDAGAVFVGWLLAQAILLVKKLR